MLARAMALLFCLGCASAPPAHQRIERRADARASREVLWNATAVRFAPGTGRDLLIHFHGAAWLPIQVAPAALHVAVVHLGSGSRVYEQPFLDPEAFPRLLESLGAKFDRVYVSAFSAGYGAVRAILRTHADAIEGVLLLDGLHTSYVPEGSPGTLDIAKLEPFVAFARRAVAEEKAFVVSHSEIVPGSYASTTECADHLLSALALRRKAVQRRGPAGMRQLSEARGGRFVVLGYAGTTAAGHVDHLHALGELLRLPEIGARRPW